MLIMLSPIAFHPASILFNNPNLQQLYDSPGVAPMINGIVDELIELSHALGCEFEADFRDKIIATMKLPPTIEGSSSVMYQDYLGNRNIPWFSTQTGEEANHHLTSPRSSIRHPT
jgi:hypothetical protein